MSQLNTAAPDSHDQQKLAQEEKKDLHVGQIAGDDDQIKQDRDKVIKEDVVNVIMKKAKK